MIVPSKRSHALNENILILMKIYLAYSKTHKKSFKKKFILPDTEIIAISKAICISLMFENLSDTFIHPEITCSQLSLKVNFYTVFKKKIIDFSAYFSTIHLFFNAAQSSVCQFTRTYRLVSKPKPALRCQ